MTPTLLIVDDEEMIRDIFIQVAEIAGYTPVIATNGEEAVGIIDEDSIDVVLTDFDYKTPGMNGNDVTKYAKQKGLPVIMVSGTSENKETAEQCGVDHFIGKPTPLPVLIDILKQYK